MTGSGPEIWSAWILTLRVVGSEAEILGAMVLILVKYHWNGTSDVVCNVAVSGSEGRLWSWVWVLGGD